MVAAGRGFFINFASNTKEAKHEESDCSYRHIIDF